MNTNSNEEKSFLNRLTKITETNLSNEQFGVSELVREMGMSRSHVHRHLKALTNQSISQFICTIRLKKAMETLQQNEATASEIAYMVGFGSPTYFNHCFHEYFGYPPGEVRKNGFNSTDQTSTNENQEFPEKTPTKLIQEHKLKWVNRRRNLVLVSVGVIFLLLFFYIVFDIFILSPYATKSLASTEKSVIVLPFKNLSPDEGNQYFADGITEDILNNLYWISSLRVVSRTSAEQFRKSSLSVREIARKMNVNYVLEGSVRQYDKTTRISVQLIDADRDEHLWSSNFDRELNDIIGVQGDIALQVAKKLNTILSANEIRQIEKISTQNPEAYDFYLRARFLLHKANSAQRSDFDKESVMSCLQYYEKAIAADTTFAEAYAGLANAWFNLSAWGWLQSNEGFLKARDLSLKALKIDPECAEAHAVLGAFLVWGIRNIEEGGKELKTSVQLNPNFAIARQWYAQFLMITGPIEDACKQINYALELEPYFWVIQNLNSWLYYFEEKYQKSLEACIVAHDYNPNFSSNEWLFVLNYAKLDEGKKLMQQLQNISKRHSKTDKYYDEIQEAYNQYGINGLFAWLIKLNKNTPIPVEGMSGHPFYIAWWNAILGNKDESIYWLEKNMEIQKRLYHYFNLIATNPDFDILRDDPRFRKIVDKIGLTTYHKRPAK